MLYLSTKGEPTSEQNTMKEIKHMSTSSLWVQQSTLWKQDNAIVSTKTQSIYRTHITEGCQWIEYKVTLSKRYAYQISCICPLNSPSSDPFKNVKFWDCRVTSPYVRQKCAQVKELFILPLLKFTGQQYRQFNIPND